MIEAPKPADFAEWSRLFAAYATFYHLPQTDEMRARVWSWIMEGSHQMQALVARAPGEGAGGKLLGLAHFRSLASPLTANVDGFLDDLFVDPDQRGSGIARALIHAVQAEGKAKGWAVVSWLTAQDNVRARRLYDQIAQGTSWVTYEMTV